MKIYYSMFMIMIIITKHLMNLYINALLIQNLDQKLIGITMTYKVILMQFGADKIQFLIII
jgi:hypothetical protein